MQDIRSVPAEVNQVKSDYFTLKNPNPFPAGGHQVDSSWSGPDQLVLLEEAILNLREKASPLLACLMFCSLEMFDQYDILKHLRSLGLQGLR